MELEGYGSESSAASSLGDVGTPAPPVDRYPVSYAGKCHQRELVTPTHSDTDYMYCIIWL